MKKRLKKLEQLIPRTRRQQFIFAVAAIFLLLFAAPVLYLLVKNSGSTAPAPGPEAVTYSTDMPSENLPGDNYVWPGHPEDPKKIVISSVGIDGYIQNVGVDQNNEIAVPNNVHIAGWFVDSVRPGQQGLSIIDGHVSGRTTDGIFKALPNVAEGAEIIVEFGNGQAKIFRVLDVATVPVAEAPGVLFSQNPSVSNQLNLITCVGAFDRQTGRYQDRVIVSAELVD